MFRRISYTLALQFTAFVFVLLLINGLLFLAVDFGNAQRTARFRLLRTAQLVLDRAQLGIDSLSASLPPSIQGRVRIVDTFGRTVYSGDLFAGVPFAKTTGYSQAMMQNEEYIVLTTPIMHDDDVAGYIQVADVERLQFAELPFRALLYLLGSVAVSLLTFFVGLFFARRNLRPAEQMMQRLEQFTQDASHELRTPLSALNSSLDLALTTKKYREGIASAKEDVQEITSLIERLLELARLDQFLVEAAPVDLAALVSDTVERSRAFAEERGVTLAVQLTAVTVQGDAALLRQVIGNLLTNAIKFNHPGGSVTLTLTKRTLTVTDTGIGIARAEQARIFDRFYQADTSRAADGYGLGLALVKRILDLHGWTIAVQSVPGQGTTFSITFRKQGGKAQRRPVAAS